MKFVSQEVISTKTWDVLVVDADPTTGDLVRRGGGTRVGQVRVVETVDQAALEMRTHPADVVMVNVQINDNGGIELLRKLHRKYPQCEAIAMSRTKRSELCVDALRAGAADILVGPVTVEDVKTAFANVAERQTGLARLQNRNLRLREVCKRLSKARQEISKQVDLLCNDLVRAYQEMAQQLNHTQVTTEYSMMLQDELEVEGVLRKTMEWVLKKLGPINAAVYLPDGERNFALGAYLNLDTEADAKLIEQIGRTVVREVECSGQAVTIETNEQLRGHFGNDAGLMEGRTWYASSCVAKRESLAVLVIFRRQGDPLDAALRQLVEAVCPLLAAKIDEALELYNRMNPLEDEDEEGDGGTLERE